MNNRITILIEDISEGSEKGFAARIPELHNSLAMGGDMKELFDGIDLTLECARDYDVVVAKNANEYMAVLRDYKDSAVIAPNLKDLFEAVESTIKLARKKGVQFKHIVVTYRKKKARTRRQAA